MRSQKIFCGACDREVRVMITDAPQHESQAPIYDEGVVCLEIGEKCTGNVCPIGAGEPSAMIARLVRNGLPLDNLRTAKARCLSCGGDVDMVLYGDGRAACSVCGSQMRWSIDHVEPIT